MRKVVWLFAVALQLLRCGGKSSASDTGGGDGSRARGGSAGATDAGATDAGGGTSDEVECRSVLDCRFQTDAGSLSLLSCDPVSNRCVEPCGAVFVGLDGGLPMPDPCAPERQCLYQQRDSNTYFGACYETCDPTTGMGCSAGFRCGHLPPLQGGVAGCVKAGNAGPGEPCGSEGCRDGFYCSGADGTLCRTACNFWDAEPGCVDGELCSDYGPPPWETGLCVARPEQGGDPAPLGSPCASAYFVCGSDGKAWRGFCGSPCGATACKSPPDSPICLAKCRTDDDCPSDYPTCFDGYGGHCVLAVEP